MPVPPRRPARAGRTSPAFPPSAAALLLACAGAALPFAIAVMVAFRDGGAVPAWRAGAGMLILGALAGLALLAGAAWLGLRNRVATPADPGDPHRPDRPDAAPHGSGETLREIVESMPYACMINDESFRITAWNPAAERMFGWAASDILGRDSVALITPEPDRAQVYALLRDLPAGGRAVGAANVNLHRDGRRIVCEWSNARLSGADGRFIGFLSTALDVTRRAADEEALRVSEARFRQLTAMSSDWFWEQDEQFRFVATEQARDRPDRPLGESVGVTRWERPGTRPVGTTWEEHRKVLEAHLPFAHLVLEVERGDEGLGYVAVRGEPLFDERGAFKGYRGVGSDISERFRNDVMRAGERRLFERLVTGAPLPELMGQLCETIEAALHTRGVASVMVMEEGRLLPLAAPSVPAAMVKVIEHGIVPGPLEGSCGSAVFGGEVVICADIATDPRWDKYREAAALGGFAASWSTPVRDSAGTVVAAVAVYRTHCGAPVAEDLERTRVAADLAGVLLERFRADAALRESDSRYRSLVELSQDAVLIHDEGVIRYANPALARMLKAPSPEDLIGRNILDHLDAESREAAQRRRRRIVEQGQTVGYSEFRLICLDGSGLDVEAAGGPVELEGRRMIQSYMRDISARKWTEREMQRLNESLEARVSARTAELTAAVAELESFSYTVAHDLRAPLRAIVGYSQMVRLAHDAALGEAGRRDLEMVVGSAQRMAELIDGLLEFSRLSRGTTSYQRVSMRSLVAAVLADAQAAHGHRPELVVDALPDVYGDPAMLRQVWQNLIMNAFKFTARVPAPRIEMRCARGEGEAVFSVIDNGAGFDPAFAAKLFGMFQRLHSRSEFEGTGVGLAIVKRIVERHHGRVEAEGAPGRGATFRFTLPETSVVEAGTMASDVHAP